MIKSQPNLEDALADFEAVLFAAAISSPLSCDFAQVTRLLVQELSPLLPSASGSNQNSG